MFHVLCRIHVSTRSCFVFSTYILGSIDDTLQALTFASKSSDGSVASEEGIGSLVSSLRTQETTHQVGRNFTDA
jgi:hypothetical protein